MSADLAPLELVPSRLVPGAWTFNRTPTAEEAARIAERLAPLYVAAARETWDRLVVEVLGPALAPVFARVAELAADPRLVEFAAALAEAERAGGDR